MKYKYILFDADDTLLDFKTDEAKAVSDLLIEYGIDPTPLLIETYSNINLGLWKQFERGEISKLDITERRFTYFLREIGVEGDGIELDKRYRHHLSEGGVKILDADIVCAELKRKGYRLFIVTNGIEYIQSKRFIKAGLTPYFEKVFISEKLGCRKPMAEFFDKVFKEIGSDNKSDYLIIGDSLSSDILGGKNACIDTCWCNFRNVENNSDLVPDYTITKLTDILDIL